MDNNSLEQRLYNSGVLPLKSQIFIMVYPNVNLLPICCSIRTAHTHTHIYIERLHFKFEAYG